MFKALILICLPLFSTLEYRNVKQEKEPVSSFMNFIVETHIRSKSFILLDDAESTEFIKCSNAIFKDTLLITRAQQAELQAKFNSTYNDFWLSKSVPNANIVDTGVIKDIIADHRNKGWAHFKNAYGGAFYVFSAPMFFNNNKLCLFYIDRHCGELCNEGKIVLYRFTEGRWVTVHEFCYWKS